MKHKILILLILASIFLSGCGTFNLNGWIIPNDTEFFKLVEELDTPHKICNYMRDNFTYEYKKSGTKTPFELYITKIGDCNDFSIFGTYIANYNGYETYQIRIIYLDSKVAHWLGVFAEEDGYTYSSNKFYSYISFNSFIEIVENYSNKKNRVWIEYKVYDYNNILIGEGNK